MRIDFLTKLIISSFVLMFLSIAVDRNDLRNENEELKEKIELDHKLAQKKNFYHGVTSEKPFVIKTMVSKNSGNKNITVKEEIVLNDVKWARLELWPSVSATKPTLFYIDNQNKVKWIQQVDSVKIL